MSFLRHPALRITALTFGLALITGCQSFTSAPSTARLRVIDLSLDAGTLDVYQNGRSVAFNLAYGAVTSYVALRPGTFGTDVASAGSKRTLSSAKATLLPGGQYTLLVGGPLVDLQQTLLADQPPTSGPAIRFIHQAERTGPVDVYMVPAGRRLALLTPVAANLAPGAVTVYLPVPEGICAALVLPAGTRPSTDGLALHLGPRSQYLHGSARTLIMLDASPTSTRSMDVIETTDAEPES